MNSTATVYLDPKRVISEISPLLFGGFAEHMGRCIYGGIYDPASPFADEQGFRTDVLDALREVNYRIIRYPGGNFVSGYRWQDGVGPQADRPRRRELAWQSVETNQFGTDEFMQFCGKIGAEPMMGLNLGTGSPRDAADLFEYVNAPTGTYYSDMRARNGHAEPYGAKYWCLGNEMDGPWQIGALGALEYGLKAQETAKLLRVQDPNVKLILCGSSTTSLATYPEWDRIALEACWESTDYLSLHYYATNYPDDTPSYLAMSAQFESQLDTLAATIRFVKAKRRSKHDVYLSWDEWNVWYKDTTGDGKWQVGPHLSEEVYNLEDALVVAQWMNVFLRRSDVLKMACLAQIVNTISPLTTSAEGLLKQTTHFPLVMFSRYASGVALDAVVESPTYETKLFGEMPLLDVSASLDEESGRAAVFLVNRSLEGPLNVDIVWREGQPKAVEAAYQLLGSGPKAVNTFSNPNAVTLKPVQVGPVVNGRLSVTLPPLSFTTISLEA